MNLFSKNIVFIIIIIIMAFISTGCNIFPKDEEALAPPLIQPESVTYDTFEVKKTSISKEINDIGTFVLANYENINYKYAKAVMRSINVKPGDNIEAGAVVAELETDNIEYQIKQQEINLQKMKDSYLIAKIDYEDNKSAKFKLLMHQAELNVKLADLELKNLKKQYDRAMIISPVSGVVVWVDPNVKAGDSVNAFQTFIRVADPSQLLLSYDGKRVSDIKYGDKIAVIVNGVQYKGKVVMLPYDMPDSIGDDLKGSVLMEADNLPQDVTAGTTADFKLVLQKKDNVIVIPKNLIDYDKGFGTVQILDGKGMKVERVVEVGIESSFEAEIIKGLDVGDKVIIN